MKEYKLTPYQQGIYIEQKYHLDAAQAYTTPVVVEIKGLVNHAILVEAFERLVYENIILSGYFVESDQGVRHYCTGLPQIKLEKILSSEREAFLEMLQNQTICVYENVVDFRVIISPDQASSVLLYFGHSHLVADGYSIDLMIKRFFYIYDLLNLEQQSDSFESTNYYTYWSQHENQIVSRYWCAEKDLSPYFTFPSPMERPPLRSFQGASRVFLFDLTQQQIIQALSKKYRCSSTIIVLTCCYIMFSKYSQQSLVSLGIALANRTVESDEIIGCFTNVLPVALTVDARQSALSLLNTLRDQIGQALEYGSYPALNLIQTLSQQRMPAFHPLYQIIFASQLIQPLHDARDYQVSKTLLHNGKAKFDLTLNYFHSDNAHSLGIEYNTALYSIETIQQLWESFSSILYNIYDENFSQRCVSDIPMISNQLRQKLLHDWNATSACYPEDKTLQELFTEQATRTPSAIALVLDNKTMTYHRLDALSNQLAHYLISHTSQQAFIGIAVERSFDMLTGILGILKAGCAYVPLDVDWPVERLRMHVQDSSMKFIFTQTKFSEKFHNLAVSLVLLDESPAEEYPAHKISVRSKPDDLAYIMYTSGTTGRPKGVMITHRGIINRLNWMQASYPLSGLDVVLHKTPFVFDVSVWELFWAHQVGASIVLAKPGGHRESDYLYQLIVSRQVTVFHMVPSLLEVLLLDWKSKGYRLPEHVRYVFCSGEVLPLECVRGLYSIAGKNLSIHNLYGPTEASIDVTAFACSPECQQVLLGRPIHNTTAYVLNMDLQLLPPGVTGELYLGGVGVARGYLNQPDLTAERFIPNPFGEGNLYKTGDLVRWLHSGELEYIGRNDTQIKVRGFRIECGEIEACLRNAPGVVSAVVIHRKQRLLAYYLGDASEAELCQHLEKHLPEYMVPCACLRLAQFPLTTNGKLDRNALPEPGMHKHIDEYIAPESALEKALCEIWEEVFGVERIGIKDDFFRLGGHSILAIQLLGKINRELNCQIEVKTLFTVKTIEKLVRIVQETHGSFKYRQYIITPEFIAEHKNHIFEPFDLTNVQQAYLLGRYGHFELGNTSAHTYQELVFTVLDVEKLERAFNVLLQRHLSLRTIFHENTQQVLSDVGYYSFVKHECQSEAALLEVRKRLSHKIYVVSQYPLFDIEISQFSNHFHLHLSIDLLLMDGRSYTVFLSEWAQLYHNIDAHLPPLNLTFSDYMAHYQKIRQSSFMEDAQRYWETKLPEYDFTMSLPLKIQPWLISQPEFTRLETVIDTKTWQSLKDKAAAHHVGLTSVFLTLYGYLLLRWSHQDRVCINLTLFNRLPLHKDVNTIVGDFTLLELFNFIDSGSLFSQQVLQTHRQLWEDLEQNIFDGIDVQRLARKVHHFESTRALAPVVLSSMLGMDNAALKFNDYKETACSITQTPQIYLDNQLHERPEGLVIIWDYLKPLFEEEMIQMLHDQYCELIRYVATHSWDVDLSSMLLPKQDHELITLANNASQPISEETLFSLFNRQVEREPDAIAVIFREKNYSYQFIAKESRSLAQALIHRYGQQSLIAVLCEKHVEQVIMTLGIMQAGSAYLPLQVSWPVDRIHLILQQSGVKVVLVSAMQRDLFKDTLLMQHYDLVSIDTLLCDPVKQDLALPTVDCQQFAYVIFTSGSTGTPKGVTITHLAAVNTVLAVNQRLNVTEKDRILALADLSFDLSVYDIFGMLAQGGVIVYPDQEDTQQPDRWLKFLSEYQITLWNSVPQYMQLLVDAIKQVQSLSVSNASIFSLNHMRWGLLSGDRIEKALVRDVHRYLPAMKLLGLGGATEGSIWSIWHELKPNEAMIPYGRAMPNQQIYVLNNKQAHAPVGVTGEIYIGGLGVASGYWNDEEKTSQQFVDIPGLGRVYRTGDLGRWCKEGFVEFLGRNDNQIKRHGFRIELDEITQYLLKLKGVAQAIVQMKDNTLVAYVVLSIAQDDFDTVAAQMLRQHLPHYMLPDEYVVLTHLPLTANGKVDFKALSPLKRAQADAMVIPYTILQAKICDIWQDVLKIQSIGVTDDFFVIGGDSIAGIQVVSRLRFNDMDCRIQDLYEHRTIKNLAAFLIDKGNQVDVYAEQGILTGSFHLTPIQEWFVEHCFHEKYAWNQAYLIRVPKLEIELLKTSLLALVEHHDMLRVRINEKQHCLQTWSDSFQDIPFEAHQFSELCGYSEHTLLAEWKNKFDWSDSWLWRLDYVEGFPDESARLLLTAHHAIIDPVSIRIIITDLFHLYSGKSCPPKLTSYRQWQQALYDYVGEHPEELAFWQAQQVPQGLTFYDKGDSIHRYTFHLNEDQTSNLLQRANLAYHTEIHDLLITALGLALTNWLNKTEHYVTIVGHGREAIMDNIDVSNTVGVFTALYPLRINIENSSLSSQIIAIKEILRSVPHKGTTYGAFCSYSQNTSLRAQTLPAIHFGYLGRFTDQNEVWQLMSENMSDLVQPAEAEDFVTAIHCWVAHHKLHVELDVRAQKENGQALSIALQQALQDVITHCMSQIQIEHYSYTPSDFIAVRTEADLKSLPLRADKLHHFAPFPMSEMQKAFALGRLGAFEIGNVANHFYREFTFLSLDVSCLERALNQLITHQPAMRLIFDPLNFTGCYLPWSEHTRYNIVVHEFNELFHASKLNNIREKFSHFVYDISTYPLFHLSVSRFIDRAILHFSFDMMLFDLETLSQFYTTLTALYQDAIHLDEVLPETINFRDYQCYLNMLNRSSWYQRDQAYWQEKVKKLPDRPCLWMAVDSMTIKQPCFKMNHLTVHAASWLKVKQKAEQHGISPGAILLAVYGLVLRHISLTPEFLITITLLNRYAIHPDVPYLWGDFTGVNLFGFSHSCGTILEFFTQIHRELMVDLDHSLYSGLNVQRDFSSLRQLTPGTAVSPIVFTSVKAQGSERLPLFDYFLNDTECKNENYLIGQTSQAWIDLQVTEIEDNLQSTWLYVSQLFPDELIAALNQEYCQLIDVLAQKDWRELLPEISLSSVWTDKIERFRQDKKNERVELIDVLKQRTAAQQVILHEHANQLLAYLISADYTQSTSDYRYLQTFKLHEKGIRVDLDDYFTCDFDLDGDAYRRQKSYRHFISAPIQDISLGLDQSLATKVSGGKITWLQLLSILKPLSAIRIPGKILPKYLYASAGHSYAVQCYVHVSDTFGPLSCGIYYYHPLKMSLQRVASYTDAKVMTLTFKVYKSAIEPLYPQEWLRFAYIELGHILYEILTPLFSQDTGYEILIPDSSESQQSPYQTLAHLVFDNSEQDLFSQYCCADLLFREGERFVSASPAMPVYYDLTEQNLVVKTSSLGQLLEKTPCLIVFNGQHKPYTWIEAGFKAQALKQKWLEKNIGTCGLSIKPFEDTVYALAVGMIAQEEKLAAESTLIELDELHQALTDAVKIALPEARLPDHYILLNELPVAEDGQSELPLPEFMNNTIQSAYVAPRTEIEKQMCVVWEQVLGLAQVGIHDDFFKIGGDSISCMQVSAKLHQSGLLCSVKLIFEHRSIGHIAQYIEIKQDEQEFDVDDSGISDKLRQKLERTYSKSSSTY